MNGPYVVLETEEPGDETDLHHAGSKDEGFTITWTNHERLVALEVITAPGPRAGLSDYSPRTHSQTSSSYSVHALTVTGQNSSPGQEQVLCFNNEH